jgi:hypothetical protein
VDPCVKVKPRFNAGFVGTDSLLTQQIHNPIIVIKVDDAPHGYFSSDKAAQQTAMMQHRPERASMVIDVARGNRGEIAIGTKARKLHTYTREVNTFFIGTL